MSRCVSIRQASLRPLRREPSACAEGGGRSFDRRLRRRRRCAGQAAHAGAGAVEDAKDYLDQHDISRARFERVTKLVEGFESPYGLELLATVHWVMSREGATQHEKRGTSGL